MATFDLNFVSKILLFIGKFSRLELFFDNTSSQTFSCNVASQQEH